VIVQGQGDSDWIEVDEVEQVSVVAVAAAAAAAVVAVDDEILSIAGLGRGSATSWTIERSRV
jgi:hypothetical protein